MPIITYERLYEVLRDEKYKPELQKLNKEFFGDVKNYLKEKHTILESQKQKSSIFASTEVSKTQKQLENIRKILRELYERRENKIIQTALLSSRSLTKTKNTNMLAEELELYTTLRDNFNFYRKGVLFNLLSQKDPSLEKPKDIKTQIKDKSKLVRVLHSIPKFVGEDMNVYGPFEAEDLANLPEKISAVLIKKKRAEEIRI